MENNNNLTQENRAFKKEDAYETLGIINTWIGNMDTKVSFALALAGVLIGVIFAFPLTPSSPSRSLLAMSVRKKSKRASLTAVS